MPDQAALQRSALADLPDVVDLRALADDTLERRGMDLRRRIAGVRHQVNAALEERVFRSNNPPADAKTRRIEAFVEELHLVLEALRSALGDVEREQDRRAECALREREQRILDSTRWATWAAFAAAVSAVVAGLLSRR